MTGFKQLSEYFSDDGRKKADIVKELGTSHYIVRVTNDAGSVFSATFQTEDDAEEYAEGWVQ
jgi:hypothetical protein